VNHRSFLLALLVLVALAVAGEASPATLAPPASAIRASGSPHLVTSPPVDPGPGPLPVYFADWLPNDAAPVDETGVVLVDYGGHTGLQYNPLTIAQAAIRYYDRWYGERWLPSPGAETKRVADLEAFFAQINWLVQNQLPDGRWLYHFSWGSQPVPWWSGMAEGVAISALLRAYSITGDEAYLPVITRARATFDRSIEESGVSSVVHLSQREVVVYEEYLPGYSREVLNGWIFAVVGLYEAATYLHDPGAALDVYGPDRGLDAIAALLPRYDTGSWSRYSLAPPPGRARSLLASKYYHSVHVMQLRYLATISDDPTFARYAGLFQGYLDACTRQGECPPSKKAAVPAGGGAPALGSSIIAGLRASIPRAR
jgi:hypothetical protein